MLDWASLFEQRGRDDEDRWWRVGKTHIGDTEISTVWLGLDHNWGDGPPLIFESMVFGGSLDGEMSRYSTWEQAERGHELLVEEVRWRWRIDDLHARTIARITANNA